MADRVAVVLGAGGVSGQAVVQACQEDGGFSAVVACTSRDADLMDVGKTRDRFRGIVASADGDDVRFHLFYCAYVQGANPKDTQERNIAMFKHALKAASDVFGDRVGHLMVLTGTKWNGVHLGPEKWPEYSTPLHEDGPRHPGDNFYYDFMDHVAASWPYPWNEVRPFTIIGHSSSRPMNLGTGLAAYAAVCKAAGAPFRFPGSAGCWNAVADASDAGLLARSMVRLSLGARGRVNEAYNITNGATFRWRDVWPQLAEALDLAWEGPGSGGRLGELLRGLDAEAVWSRVRSEHDLKDAPEDLFALIPVTFLQFVFARDWDVDTSLEKAHKDGVLTEAEVLPMADCLTALFQSLSDARLLPPLLGAKRRRQAPACGLSAA